MTSHRFPWTHGCDHPLRAHDFCPTGYSKNRPIRLGQLKHRKFIGDMKRYDNPYQHGSSWCFSIASSLNKNNTANEIWESSSPNLWLKQIHPNLFHLSQLLLSRSPVLCWVDPPATVPYCGLPNVRSLVLECVPLGEKRMFGGVRNPGALEWLVRVILVVTRNGFWWPSLDYSDDVVVGHVARTWNRATYGWW